MYCKINWFDTLDSTQEEVRRHISELDNLSVTAALYQTSGKGQRGNRWDSEKGRNLMFSILLRPGLGGVPEVPAPGQFFISLVASLAVHATLQDYGISSKIKWPNDIYAGNKKICGMLIENTLGPKGIKESIIGIGLNVNQTDFPPQLMNPTSMARLTHREYDIKEVLDKLLGHFTDFLGTPAGQLRESYLSHLFRLGERAEYVDTASGESFEGIIKGITDDAFLLVEKSGGEIRRYAFKEISYVL